MTTYFTPEFNGAAGNGIADDTAAWQATLNALPAHGGTILAAGIYKVGQLNVTKPVKIEFQGGVAGVSARLMARDATGPVLNVTAQGFSAKGLVIGSDAPRTSGAYVRLENAPFFSITDFDFRAPYIGVEIINSSIGRLCHGSIRNATKSSVAAGSAGIVIGGNASGYSTAVVIDDVVMDTELATTSPPAVGDMPSYGILITQSDAVIIANCDIIRAGKDLTVMPANGHGVANTYVHDSFFDTALRGISVEPALGGQVGRIWLGNVWASSQNEYGVYLGGQGTIVGVHADRLQAELNTLDGVRIENKATDTWIDHGSFAQNKGAGISVAEGAQKFKIRSNKVGPHDDFGPNNFGVYIGAGCGDYEIRDNDLRGNTTIALSENALAATGYTTRNLGYATRTSGTADLLSGTSVTVNHGLASAPPIAKLSVTPVSAWSAASQFWIDSASVTATQFVIHVDVAPGSPMYFAWQATTEKD